jgi:hypothetical protein
MYVAGRQMSGFYFYRKLKEERAAAAALREENGRLRAALEWYGEQSRLCRLIHSEGDAGRNALAADGGKRAKEALAAAPGPATEVNNAK